MLSCVRNRTIAFGTYQGHCNQGFKLAHAESSLLMMCQSEIDLSAHYCAAVKDPERKNLALYGQHLKEALMMIVGRRRRFMIQVLV